MPIYMTKTFVVGIVIGLLVGYGAFRLTQQQTQSFQGTNVTASVVYLLSLPGINGTSNVPGYTSYIKLDAWSIAPAGGGANIAGTPGGSGSPNQVIVIDPTSKASPQIQQAFAKGTHFNNATIVGVKNVGGKQTTIMIATLNNCLIASYQASVPNNYGQNNAPEESFSIGFQTMRQNYTSS